VTYYLKMVALTVIETIGIAVVLFLLLIGQCILARTGTRARPSQARRRASHCLQPRLISRKMTKDPGHGSDARGLCVYTLRLRMPRTGPEGGHGRTGSRRTSRRGDEAHWRRRYFRARKAHAVGRYRATLPSRSSDSRLCADRAPTSPTIGEYAPATQNRPASSPVTG
jgi:hypothetical protein